MQHFEGRIAVVTGGGSGMGRELVRQLAEAGCHVAMCDVSADDMSETEELARATAPEGTRVLGHLANVSQPAELVVFATNVRDSFATEHINLLFNNAGIGGGGSFVLDDVAEWDRTFDVCWGGVYHCTRAFLPMLLASDQGHVVNTSSVNGFWASLGPATAHTAYSAAKFAVKGFTEALITDFRLNAPHLRASVVMPGHIGTSIVLNSMKAAGRNPKELDVEQIRQIRERFAQRGMPLDAASDEDIRQGMQMQAEMFRDNAPMTAAAAATEILAAVRRGDWRILVGADAVALDDLVRATPTEAYDEAFFDRIRSGGAFGGLG